MADPKIITEWLKKADEDYDFAVSIDTRYPVHWPTHYTKEEAIKAQKATKHIRDIIT